MVVLQRGRIFTDGAPADVLTPETLREVFGVNAHVMAGPDGSGLIVVPVGRV
jgi:iron complex transport system ATP-binding protein